MRGRDTVNCALSGFLFGLFNSRSKQGYLLTGVSLEGWLAVMLLVAEVQDHRMDLDRLALFLISAGFGYCIAMMADVEKDNASVTPRFQP